MTTPSAPTVPESSAPTGRLPRNVLTLGWVSFFTDLASEMLYPIRPLFVTQVLGASPAVLGLIDGVAEGASSVLRWLAGAMSDRFRRRKPFVVWGYSVSAISKPLMGLAAYAIGWPLFFAALCLDRLGKSTRTSARDALIADSTPAAQRGAAFGVHRAMDTAGAVVGPLVALAAITLIPYFRDHLQWLFMIALIPGLFSAAIAFFAVRDIPHTPDPTAKPAPIFQSFGAPFWHLIAAAGVFGLGNSSDTFLLLKSSKLGLSFAQVILAFAVYNVVYAAASAPFGKLSDRIGRRKVVSIGWGVYAAVYLGFSLTRGVTAPWVLMAAYGLYQALAEGVSKALISDVVAHDQRAGAIGMFYTVAGLSQLVASLLAGVLWSYYAGPFHLPFLIGAVLALVAIPVIATVPSRRADAVA